MTFHLGKSTHPETGKPTLTLNRSPFYPIGYFSDFKEISTDMLNNLREKGFNCIVLVMDAVEAGTPELHTALELCRQKSFPVIVEVNEWSLWKHLQEHPDLNMVMAGGKPVQYFPDYANPQTRKMHLDLYRKSAQFIRKYAHSPVVAISVGAYDAYHLPDGEIHADFTVPEAKTKYSTMLPYGRHAENAFAEYLAQQNETASNLDGRQKPPISLDRAIEAKHWKQWILFRRFLVRQWLGDTLDVVRQETGLPATVTFDINFSLNEQFATPPYYWEDLLDFVIVYYYGRSSSGDFIEPLLRTVYQSFSEANLPMLTLLEFSSSLAGGTPAEVYLKQSAPFVSGVCTSPPHGNIELGHTEERVDEFTNWIFSNREKLDTLQPEKADLLILVDEETIFFENPFSPVLSNRGISYDILYVREGENLPSFDQYRHILIPSQFSEKIKSKLQTSEKVIFENDSPPWLEQIAASSSPNEHSIEGWVPAEVILEENFDSKSLALWESTLSTGSWKVENGILEIHKTGQDMKGLGSMKSLSSPFRIENRVKSLMSNQWHFSLLDCKAYPPNSNTPGSGLNEISWGVEPLSQHQGEFGIFTHTWIPVCRLPIERFFVYEFNVLPCTQAKDLIYIRLREEESGKIYYEHRYLVDKRGNDRLWLLWAYENAAAEIDFVKVSKLKQVRK